MTHANGWPDKERPGYPMFPERGGYHWLSNNGKDEPFPIKWKKEEFSDAPDEWSWDWGDDGYEDIEVTGRLHYHGPCLTPDELTALLRAERERCAKVCDKRAGSTDCVYMELAAAERESYWDGVNSGASSCAAEIRNLSDEPPCTLS